MSLNLRLSCFSFPSAGIKGCTQFIQCYKDFPDWAKSSTIELSFMTGICHKVVYRWVLYDLNVKAIMCAYACGRGTCMSWCAYGDQNTTLGAGPHLHLVSGKMSYGLLSQASGLSPFLACPLAVGMVKLLASFTKSRFYWVLGIWINFSILVLQTFFQLSHCLNLFASILLFKNTYHEYIHMYTFNCFTC